MKKDKIEKPKKEVAAEATRPTPRNTDFRSLLGIGRRVPMNPNPKFTNEDQLWEKDVD